MQIMHRATKWVAWTALGILLALAVLGGHWSAGYDPLRHWISHLVLGPYGAWYAASLVLAGVCLWWAARGFQAPFRLARAAVMVAACGLIAAGLLPTDPGLGYPPGVQEAFSTHGAVHRLSGLAVFGGLIVAPLAWAGVARKRAGPLARVSLAVGIMVLAEWLTCSALAALDFSGVLSPAPSGLFERLALATGVAWVVVALHCVQPSQSVP